MSDSCNSKKCFCFLAVLVEIANFICICILVSLSRNNPFEKHTIGNLDKYFKNVSEKDIINLIPNDEKNFYTFNSSISTYVNLNNKSNLRKLVSEAFCSEYYGFFEQYQGKKLSSIFDVKYNKIHKLSIAILIVSCSMIGSTILILIFLMPFFSDKCPKCYCKAFQYCLGCLFLLLSLVVITTFMGRFVLTFILLYYIEKSDIEDYDNFLDCHNVKVNVFKDISDINRLRGCFYAFLVINIIVLGIERIEKFLDFIESYSKNKNKDKKNKNVEINNTSANPIN